jgi:hypothetical protein
LKRVPVVGETMNDTPGPEAPKQPVPSPDIPALIELLRPLAEAAAAGAGTASVNRDVLMRASKLYNELQSLPRMLHLKRQSTYIRLGQAKLQLACPTAPDGSRPAVEGNFFTVYRCDLDGSLHARFQDEFEDGRFVRRPETEGSRDAS